MAANVVGLDIGSHAIKVVSLKKRLKKGKPVLDAMGQAFLPPTAILDGEINDPDAIVDRLKSLFDNLKIKEKNVATSLSGDAMIIKRIILPKQSQSELRENLEQEAEQYIPYDLASVALDFHIVGDSEEHPGQMEVILIAARNAIINEYIKVLKRAGLKPSLIDIDLFATLNAFEYISPKKNNGTLVIIDIGANLFHVNIIKDGISILSKDENIGSFRITEKIMDAFNCPFEHAEGIKLGAVEPPDKQIVVEIFDQVLSNWGAAFERALEQTRTEDNVWVDELYLTGGGSLLNGVEDFFNTHFNTKTQVFNPISQLHINKKHFDANYINRYGPIMAVGFGLAIRSEGLK